MKKLGKYILFEIFIFNEKKMYIVKWWTWLEWKVKISWSKNAALPILAATLLIRGKVRLKNVPKIWDVLTFLEIIQDLWVTYNFEWDILNIDTTHIDLKNFNAEMIKKIRASILLLSPILHFFGNIKIPFPWGCSIWKRPVDAHLNWLKAIWYDYEIDENNISITWDLLSWNIELNAWFWVTSTENLIVANVLRSWKTTINLCAIEPHVMNLVWFLRAAWADIKIKYNHTIIINWVDKLEKEFDYEVISDYIESWTFMVIWALASKEYIDIENARINDLYFFIDKLKLAWVKIEEIWEDILRVYKSDTLKPVDIQTNIFPWFPTDVQSPFTILMTQASWTSRVHEVLFEWRLNFLVELEKMKWHVAILNPHEAMIFWKTKLKWAQVTSWDLRAWAAMVIAWLIAEGETKVTNIEYIERWYEDFVWKLKKLWAQIEVNL